MIQRIRANWRAGRSGQPMPASVDRSIGETAGGVALTIVLVGGMFFAIGAGSAAAERLFTPLASKEVKAAKRQLELEELNLKIDQAREARKQARKDATKDEEDKDEDTKE